MESDGSVVIRVSLSKKQLESELRSVANKIAKLDREISGKQAERSKWAQSADDLGVQLDSAKAKLHEMQTAAKGAFSSEQINEQKEKVNSLQYQWNTAVGQVEKYDRQIENATAKLNQQKEYATELSDQISKSSGGWNIFNSALNSAKQGISKIPSAFSKILSVFPKLITGGKSLSKSFSGVLSSVKKIAPALLAARGIMGVLRKAVSAYMEQNQQLSNTLSGAWTGLGNILGPIITQVVNLTATAIAYVTKFLNLLGLTGKAASKQMSSAGGTAKKETDALKKQIMSFDELNVLNGDKDNAGGGGGGGDAAGYTPEVTLPDWAKLMAEQLKSAQWKEAAVTLTTALNDMVDSVNWPGIGAKIGKALDGAMTFLATAIQTFDWTGLGGKLAKSVNNIVSNVDWKNLGTILGAKFKILIDTAAGFLLGLDMAELAKAASEIIIGFFNSLTETIQNTDWYALGEQIKTFLVNIDWAGIAEAVFRTFGSALGAAGSFIAEFIGDAVQSIKNYFMEYINKYIAMCPDEENLGYYIIAGILEGIVKAVAGIGTWICEHIFQPFIDGFKDAFGIHSPSTVMAEQGGYIIDGLLIGITSAWQNVKAWISTALSDIKDAFSEAWSKIQETTSSIWNGIVGTIKGAVNGVISVINRMISAVVNGINSLLRALSFNVSLPGGKSVGLNLPQFSAPQIPYLAQGAVIPPNAPFAAILGDQKSGTNIEAPLETIKQAVAEVLAQNGGGDITINFTGDLAQLARILYPEIHRQDNRAARAGGW